MRFSARNNTLSIGKESAWGTAVPTTALVPNTKHTDSLEEDFVDSATLTGSRAPYGSILVGRSGKLSVPFELNLETIGYLLKGLLGTEVVSGAGPYTHAFTMTNGALPSWTFLSGLGGYSMKNLVGAVCKSLGFEIAQKAIVTGNAEFFFKDQADTALNLIPSNVATATGIITATQAWAANDVIRFNLQDAASTLPTGLAEGVDYYVSAPTGTTFKVALTSGGAAIASFAVAGTGTFEVVRMEKLAPPTNRVLTFKDSNAATAVKVNAANFGELLSASLSFDNNLSADDYRLGNAGVLSGITAGAFSLGGKINVNMNGNSKLLRDKLLANQTVSLQLELWEDAQYGIRFLFPAVYLKGGEISNDDGGMTQSFDIVPTGSLSVSPVTVTLINAHVAAY
jgi:hypothetical protein